AYVAYALPRSGAPIVAPRNASPATTAAASGTLKVKIVDAKGTLLPARAWVENATGSRLFRPTAPASCTPYGADRSFSCDGEFEMTLPAGNVIVHIEKGKEFVPVNRPVTLVAGE